jgi:signal transduction histidine kinase
MSEANVLVVDDTPANLLAMSAVLKPLGVEIVEAKSGAEALELATSDTFAVALLDVQMPGMDGFEVARKLRNTEACKELPIIFLTAIHRDERYVKHGYEAGAADYITKPFDVDVLRARVKAFVDLFRQRDRLRVEQLSKLLESERAARREAEIASTAKDEFLATVSHELRTPLNAILGWAVIARGLTQDPQVQKALATIERNARSQVRIIEDILDMGRIVSGKLRLDITSASVDDAIRGAAFAVRPAADAKDVTVAVDVDSAVGRIAADPERLQQIVWNLLTNAIKFTPRGGAVTVRAHRVEDDVTIEVEDNGQGIGPDFLPFVFDAFKQADQTSTRRHGGLGLGLAIVRQLVQAHGGRVQVESPGIGRGATFKVVLPARRLARAVEAVESAPPPRLDGVHVLVVDDDEESRTLLDHVLHTSGARVTLAENVDEALTAMNEHPDIILSDIAMPGRDGDDLIRHVRGLPRDDGGAIPAIAVTASARSEPGVGFQAHVAKPIDPDKLLSVVAATLSAQRASG